MFNEQLPQTNKFKMTCVYLGYEYETIAYSSLEENSDALRIAAKLVLCETIRNHFKNVSEMAVSNVQAFMGLRDLRVERVS